MFKKITSLSLLILYMLFACATTLSFHYCGKQLASISFFNTVDEDNCCKKECSSNCCNDKIVSFKINDNYKQDNCDFNFVKTLKQQVKNTTYSLFEIKSNPYISTLHASSKIYTPPDIINKVPIFISICTLRI